MPTPRKWKDEAERKRAYRKKKKEEARAAKAQPSAAQPDAPSPLLAAILNTGNPNRDVLVAIRDDAEGFASDRIRAVTEIEKIDNAERAEVSDFGPVLAWRDVLAALPVAERAKVWRDAAKAVCPDCGARMNIELPAPDDYVPTIEIEEE